MSILNKNLTIIGFGNQAKSWALNLRDQGYEILIGLRPNSLNINKAKELGFSTIALEKRASLPHWPIALLTPDDTHEQILIDHQKLIAENSRIILAHGYSVFYKKLHHKFPQFNFELLAPKAIASELRFLFETKGNIGGVFSCEFSKNQKQSLNELKQLATDLGINALYPSSFKEETETDLFSEQGLLCSLIPYGALHCYNILRSKGVNKEIAYLECWYELKLIVNVMVKMGPQKFFEMISPNALVGSQKGHEKLINKDFIQGLEELYEDIQKGQFERWVDSTSEEECKQEVKSFWSKQEFTKTHNEMAQALY